MNTIVKGRVEVQEKGRRGLSWGTFLMEGNKKQYAFVIQRLCIIEYKKTKPIAVG